MAEQPTDVKALAKTLSDSYSALLQYNAQSADSISHHLEQLAKYSDHLPLSWFTPALLNVLNTLNDRGPQPAIYTLWTVWVRRLAGAPEAVTAADAQLSQVLTRLENALLDDKTSLQIRKEAWIGLVSLAGRAPSQFSDSRMIQGMARVLKQYAQQEDLVDTMGETLDAGVAHCMAQTSVLNVFEADQCEHLLNDYAQLVAKRSAGPPAAMAVMQHVVDVRSQLKPQTRADADMEALVDVVTKERPENEPLASSLVWLAILAGVVRMLQFTKDKSKKMQDMQRKTEEMLLHRFNDLIPVVMAKEHAHQFAMNQNSIAYIAGQCLPNMKTLDGMDYKAVLRILISCLLTSEQVWRNGQIIATLSNTQSCIDQLNQLTNGMVYKDIGRISRAIGAVITTGLEKDSDGSMATVVQVSLDRLVGFSYNVFIDWDRFLRVNQESHMNGSQKKIFSELSKIVWTVFKTMLFAFTAILKAVAVDIPNGEGLVNVKHAAQDILAVYANLQFITDHLGSGSGFKAYQDTLTNAVAYLTHEDGVCQLNMLLSTAYKEYAPNQYTDDHRPSTSLLTPVQLSRLTFFTNLIEQVMTHIDDKVLEADILPVIYPVLKWKKPEENKDMYESAHAAVLAVFSAQKAVSRELAGVYAQMLVDSFPEPMSLHQLRFAYSTMIQSLCQMDDALSWLATQYLLDKIHSLTSDEKDLVALSQYTTALIDLLKPLSLGPFFDRLLKEVQTLVLQPSLTNDMRTSMLKILFETVSGSGISDMRRVEAVGWFLELKRKVEAKSTTHTTTTTTTSPPSPSTEKRV